MNFFSDIFDLLFILSYLVLESRTSGKKLILDKLRYSSFLTVFEVCIFSAQQYLKNRS